MSTNSGQSDGIAASERAMAGKGSSGAPFRRQFGVVLLAGLLTVNLWLIYQEHESRRQTSIEHRFWVVCHGNYPTGERAEAFVELVAVGNREWRSAHLHGLNLEGVALPNADLHAADFKDATLAKASLNGTKLSKAKLNQTDFTEADLSGADLAGADLLQAVLKRTQLRRANLRGAILEQVEAQGANLLAADLSDAYLLMANLTGANLAGTDLAGANLEAAVLKGANLSLARLSGANLKDADFTESNWWRARGLASDQTARFIKKFPPGEKSPAALREDYQSWLKELTSNAKP